MGWTGNQIERGWTEKLQPPRRRMIHWNHVLLPIAAKENLVRAEQMGDVKSLGAKLRVGGLLRRMVQVAVESF